MAIRVKLDLDALAYDRLFEKICGVNCKHSEQTYDSWIFIVPMGKAGKAIGKGAENIKKLQKTLASKQTGESKGMVKRIRIVEFHPNPKIFIKNLISPLEVEDILVDDNTVTIKDSSKKTKSLLIGPAGSKQKLYNSILERFFHKTLKIE